MSVACVSSSIIYVRKHTLFGIDILSFACLSVYIQLMDSAGKRNLVEKELNRKANEQYRTRFVILMFMEDLKD